MEKLKINELEKFIEENKLKEMTIQDVIEDTTRVKHSILVKAEEQLGIAYEKKRLRHGCSHSRDFESYLTSKYKISLPEITTVF